MGSLNQDGSRISQSRETVRNIGGSETLSIDRVETQVIREQSAEAASDELGTNANLTTSQYSTVSNSEHIKVTTPTSDGVIERISSDVSATPTETQNPPWVGAGGGGSGESSGWTDGVGTVTVTTAADGVGMGAAPNSDERLRVLADATRKHITFNGGAGGAGQSGGHVSIQAGIGNENHGGGTVLISGGGTGTAGSVTITGGEGGIGAADGGAIQITSGAANAGGDSGAVLIDIGGASEGGSAGAISIGTQRSPSSIELGMSSVPVNVAGLLKVPTYTVGNTPSASAAGRIIYVSNGAAGNPVLAFSNGTNWLRCDTLATISAT
jgi:hypothetical protein